MDQPPGRGLYKLNEICVSSGDQTNTRLGITATGNAPSANMPFQQNVHNRSYIYDAAGNLEVSTVDAQTTLLDWNAYGKVLNTSHQGGVAPAAPSGGEHAGAGNGPAATSFGYGPDQNRWSKHLYNRASGGDGGYRRDSEWQVRDAQGNTLATYTRELTATAVPEQSPDGGETQGPGGPYDNDSPGFQAGPGKRYTYEFGDLVWKQQYLYGSSRLGQAQANKSLTPLCLDCPPDDEQGPVGGGSEVGTDYPPSPTQADDYLPRQYELTNHLGNVTTVFSETTLTYADRFAPAGDRLRPQIVSVSDYLPFGLRVARGSADLEGGYRYGFNGKELDDSGEWGAATVVYDYGFGFMIRGWLSF